jgi:transcriptional regulator with XRE-family HTH domain
MMNTSLVNAPLPTRAAAPQPETIGALLKAWRSRRRLSQLDLALDVGVSPRHLSFVETGRSRPSPELLTSLATRLEVPLRERNRLLLAAGYAPRYAERKLDAQAMEQVRGALERLITAHDPYPGVVLDRQWNVLLANRAAQGLTALLPPSLQGPPVNVIRAGLHPDGFANVTVNFDDWGGHLIDVLQREASKTADPDLVALEQEVNQFPNVRAMRERRDASWEPAPRLLVPFICELPGIGRMSLFTTRTFFGSPLDVTLEELCIELFYPADVASESLLRQMARSD